MWLAEKFDWIGLTYYGGQNWRLSGWYSNRDLPNDAGLLSDRNSDVQTELYIEFYYKDLISWNCEPELHTLQCLTLDSSVRSCRGDGLPFLLFAFSELAASFANTEVWSEC
jgi:hypothetical protein